MLVTRKHPQAGRPLKSYPIFKDPETSVLGYKLGYCARCAEPLVIALHEAESLVEAFGGEEVKPTLKEKIADALYVWADKLSGKKQKTPEEQRIDQAHENSMRAQYGLRDRGY